MMIWRERSNRPDRVSEMSTRENEKVGYGSGRQKNKEKWKKVRLRGEKGRSRQREGRRGIKGAINPT